MTTTPPPPPVTGPPGPPPEQPPTPAEQPPAGLGSRVFWVRTAERAAKTAAQVLVVALVADQTAAGGVDVTAVDWPAVLAMAAGGGLLSVLTSLASRPLGNDPSTPSAVD